MLTERYPTGNPRNNQTAPMGGVGVDEDIRKLAACQALSIAMRQGLCLYDLKERELRLANWLILETYDRGEFGGRADFHRWAKELGFWDAKGVRPKQCMEVFLELQDLGLLDWNQAQGTYELRPYQNHWIGLRRRGLLSEVRQTQNQDLALRAERPLSEALSENSREHALATGPDPVHPPLQGRSRDWAAYCQRLRAGLDNPEELKRLLEDLPPENQEQTLPAKNAGSPPAKNAGEDRRKMPVTQSVENTHLVLPAKNAGLPIASLAPDSRVKLAIEEPPAKNAGEQAKSVEDAWRYLQSVDRRGTLRGRFSGDYQALCEVNPSWVLSRAKASFEEHERYYRAQNPQYQLPDPVGWIGRIAADARLMRWRGRKS